ncbi:MAG: helix-turn-helix domain-containing protein [Nitrospirae bacterium]|nr:helix-turn-helix domain-containing protein [Nitrospirota bacterium]
MKIEIESQDIEAIAQRVTELLKPILPHNNDHDSDIVFDKKGLAAYLKVSLGTVNALVSNKQIPYFKIQPGQSGGVRFRKKNIDSWIERQSIPRINHQAG